MRRRVAIGNNKGGSGKTAAAVNLAAALAEAGHRVLVVDMNPQVNASRWLGLRFAPEYPVATTCEVVAAATDGIASEAIRPSWPCSSSRWRRLSPAGASMPSVDTVLIMIGLAVILAGVGCGVKAYQQAMREYHNEPLFPSLARMSARVAARARATGRWLLRRPTATRMIPLEQIVGVSTVNPVRPLRSGLAVPDDLPVEDQIRLLVKRMEQIEYEAAEDREWYDTQVQHLGAETGEHVGQLRASDRELDARIRAVATDTAKLQAIGLILVAVGTVITLIPVLLGL